MKANFFCTISVGKNCRDESNTLFLTDQQEYQIPGIVVMIESHDIFKIMDYSFPLNAVECFSLQGVIHVNLGKKNETSTIKSLQLGSNCLHQDSCNFEDRILHQLRKLAGIKLDVRLQVVRKCNG